METAPLTETMYFAVLVPHRDCLPALDDYRRSLFAAGLEGAWAFPAAAPLARLSRPLDTGEIKSAAAELRSLLGDRMISPVTEGAGSVRTGGECTGGECAGWGPYRFFGIMLDLPSPALPADAVLQRWEKPVLAPVCCKYHQEGPQTAFAHLRPTGSVEVHAEDAEIAKKEGSNYLLLPRIAFRAAALANLALMPVLPEKTAEFASFDADYSFTWELGPLYWLPRVN